MHVTTPWIAGFFLLGFVPFAALAWWVARATPERVRRARRRRRRVTLRCPDSAEESLDSLKRERAVWRSVAAPVLAVVALAAGGLLAWQAYRLFDSLR